MNEIVV